jgi:hypothetical protein
MKMKLHAQTLPGVVHPFHISEPVIHADNEAKKRSGHMGHGMTEFAPGKIIAFSANTSAVLGDGHAHYGWMDYAISEDYGKTFSEPRPLPYAMQNFLKVFRICSGFRRCLTAEALSPRINKMLCIGLTSEIDKLVLRQFTSIYACPVCTLRLDQ